MDGLIHKYVSHHKFLLFLAGIVLALIAASTIAFIFLNQGLMSFKKKTSASVELLNQRVSGLEAALATSTLTSEELARRLEDQQNRSAEFENTIDDINNTVGDLEKLSKTDKELLQKYSKVYFLSDNYVPLSLDSIDKEYLNDNTKNFQFHTSALPFLERMLNRAERDDIDLKIVSAYRSFGTQSQLKATYKVNYGSGANTFSADQGYSEHQLGTTVDLTTPGLAADLSISFENTEAFKWLDDNAYKYGFILSYPKNNIYYQYEPWHWRFVGVKLATHLHRNDKNFSSLEQREIDTYLIKIFD